jgi:hypothetical protein
MNKRYHRKPYTRPVLIRGPQLTSIVAVKSL